MKRLWDEGKWRESAKIIMSRRRQLMSKEQKRQAVYNPERVWRGPEVGLKRLSKAFFILARVESACRVWSQWTRRRRETINSSQIHRALKDLTWHFILSWAAILSGVDLVGEDIADTLSSQPWLIISMLSLVKVYQEGKAEQLSKLSNYGSVQLPRVLLRGWSYTRLTLKN